jgi:hypothetical protein
LCNRAVSIRFVCFFSSFEIYLVKKSKLKIQKTVNKTEPIIEEFDSLPMDTNMIEKPLPLPDLPKAPETTALVSNDNSLSWLSECLLFKQH